MTNNAVNPSDAPDGPRPYFIPAGMEFDKLPGELQAAIRAVVNPNYEEMVLKARPGVERSAGMSTSFLDYLELLCQMDVSQSLAELPSGFHLSGEHFEKIAKCLRIKGAKDNSLKLLQRAHEFRTRRPPPAVVEAPWQGPPSTKRPVEPNLGGADTSLGDEDGKTEDC